MAVFEHQSDQDFADDTAADRPQTNRSVVLLELLLSLRQHIEPKRRVARKIRRDVRDALVGGRVVFVGFADFQLGILDGREAHCRGDRLARRQLHAPAAHQVTFREHSRI